jgi:hypothetical protein
MIMNKQQLFELLKVDPRTVPDKVEFWALYAVSFYEMIFSKLDNPKQVEEAYFKMSKNLNGRTREAAEFFAAIRIAEIQDPNFWNNVGRKKLREKLKAKFINESIHFNRKDDPRDILRLRKPKIYDYEIIGDSILQNISKKEATEEEILLTIRDAVKHIKGSNKVRGYMNDNDFLSDVIDYLQEEGIKLIPKSPIQRV